MRWVLSAQLVVAAAILGICSDVLATNHLVRINEVMVGLNGNSKIQFVEILVADDVQKAWGPAGTETVGRAMLEFADGNGTVVGRFVFSSNPAPGARTVLVATAEFAALPGAPAVDAIMPALAAANSGRVCWKGNPDNSRTFPVNQCVSYGDFTGNNFGAGPPVPDSLPITAAVSLKRVSGFDPAIDPNGNADFSVGLPTPAGTSAELSQAVVENRSAAGSIRFVEAPLVEQGRNLFTKETFGGNGRTCETCHIAPSFGMSPEDVANKSADDVLFIANANQDVNVLTVTSSSTTGFSQPSDFVGVVRDQAGVSAKILAGSGNRYLIVGGLGLTGLIRDDLGNQATLVSVRAGDLSKPNPSNGSPNGLEDQTGERLTRSNSPVFPEGRALVLENIDGFAALEVMRSSPHIINAKFSGPFGWSGEFPDLGEFAAGAIKQHFPRSLQRRAGIDFRLPTTQEKNALRAFQESLLFPADGNFDLDHYVTTAKQKRGRSLFFGPAKCSKCHSGPVLAAADGSVPGSVAGENASFDTGVSNLPINVEDALPSEPAMAGAGSSTRKFNTSALFGAAINAPFFHDHSAATLEDAIAFYDTRAFLNSPAGQLIGSIPAAGLAGPRADLVAFLGALKALPFEFPRQTNLASVVLGSGGSVVRTVRLFNTGSEPAVVSSTNVSGAEAQFRFRPNLSGVTIAAGGSVQIRITFQPNTLGKHEATFELAIVSGAQAWEIGLTATGVAVPDTTPPVVTPPGDLTAEATALLSPVSIGQAVATDDVGVVSVKNDAPSAFALGTTIVTWTATDAAKNSTSTVQRVTVVDTTPPVFGAIADVTVQATGVLTPITLDIPPASDLIAVARVESDAPMVLPIGIHVVNWTAIDSSGNLSQMLHRVSVEDRSAPEMKPLDSVQVEAEGLQTEVTLITPEIAEFGTLVSIVNDAPPRFGLGTTRVLWTAKDAAGNTGSLVVLVNVVDTTAPRLTAPADIVVPTREATIAIDIGKAAAQDVVGVVEVRNNAPAAFPQGKTEVVWTARDAAGNTSTAIQIVIVGADAESPGNPVSNSGDNSGGGSISISWFAVLLALILRRNPLLVRNGQGRTSAQSK